MRGFPKKCPMSRAIWNHLDAPKYGPLASPFCGLFSLSGLFPCFFLDSVTQVCAVISTFQILRNLVTESALGKDPGAEGAMRRAGPKLFPHACLWLW